MITNNFMTTITSVFRGSSVAVPIKTYTGESGSIYSNYISNSFSSDLTFKDYPSSNWDGCYLLLGSGDSAEVSDAYALDSVVTDYTVLNQTHAFTTSYGANVMVISRIIENSSGGELTIKELGLFGANYMIAREVLDEPVILAPGERYTFTMTIGLE